MFHVCLLSAAPTVFLYFCLQHLLTAFFTISPACFISRSTMSVSQVLDLGVTRMLVHRLVRVFPYLCNGKKPPAGSGTATRRTTFRRLLSLSRRSKA